MMWARRFWIKLQSLFRRNRNAQQLDDEIQFHLDQQIAENLAAGMSPQEARYAAMRTFGNRTFLKEETRSTWGWIWLEQTVQDLRYGSRTLAKNLGFTAVAVLTLALGLGVNTTLFTAFDSIALKPLPVKDPESVVRFKRWFSSGASGDIQYAFSYPEYLHYRDQNHVFSDVIAASWPTQVPARPPAESAAQSSEPREPLHLQGQLVSANYFSALESGWRLAGLFPLKKTKLRAPILSLF